MGAVATDRRTLSSRPSVMLGLGLTLCALIGGAQAQSYDAMSCDELWYARNAIFAAKGYCFKTDRAVQAFGPRCFPPYGQLSPTEQSQVDLIARVEAGKRCSSSDAQPAPPPDTPPPAGDYARMTCDQLWYERNAIYAAKGFCFRTERARRVFGPGCFPPYGDLDAAESRRVSAIQEWEGRKGCQ